MCATQAGPAISSADNGDGFHPSALFPYTLSEHSRSCQTAMAEQETAGREARPGRWGPFSRRLPGWCPGARCGNRRRRVERGVDLVEGAAPGLVTEDPEA